MYSITIHALSIGHCKSKKNPGKWPWNYRLQAVKKVFNISFQKLKFRVQRIRRPWKGNRMNFLCLNWINIKMSVVLCRCYGSCYVGPWFRMVEEIHISFWVNTYSIVLTGCWKCVYGNVWEIWNANETLSLFFIFIFCYRYSISVSYHFISPSHNLLFRNYNYMSTSVFFLCSYVYISFSVSFAIFFFSHLQPCISRALDITRRVTTLEFDGEMKDRRRRKHGPKLMHLYAYMYHALPR